MLKIGEFSDTFLPIVDGVGRVVNAYAETLSAMGHQVTVVAPMYDTGSRAGFPYELVDFIATDSHDLPGRDNRMADAFDQLAALYGIDTAHALTHGNAEKLLAHAVNTRIF